jgi:ketosteroid isomerase-like protein
MFHPKGRYTIIGDTPISRTYVGPRGISEVLVPLLADGFKDLPVIYLDELIVEGDRGVALAHGSAPARYGTYSQKHYAFVFTIDRESVADLVEFMDPTQLHTAVFGQTLLPPPGE